MSVGSNFSVSLGADIGNAGGGGSGSGSGRGSGSVDVGDAVSGGVFTVSASYKRLGHRRDSRAVMLMPTALPSVRSLKRSLDSVAPSASVAAEFWTMEAKKRKSNALGRHSGFQAPSSSSAGTHKPLSKVANASTQSWKDGVPVEGPTSSSSSSFDAANGGAGSAASVPIELKEVRTCSGELHFY